MSQMRLNMNELYPLAFKLNYIGVSAYVEIFHLSLVIMELHSEDQVHLRIISTSGSYAAL